MNYKVISTGSKGNACLINDVLLIDCGVSYKALKSASKELKAVFLTHIHSDHFKKNTIKKLASERPALRFGCCEWLYEPLTECGVQKSNIDVLRIGHKYNYGIFSVSPVKLYHNVPNCGYRIYFGDEKMFYATDTNTLDGITAKDYDLYMIEANYEDDEIRKRIEKKQIDGKYAYEREVLNNHLSKAKCDAFIANNASNNSLFVYLHQHEEKNNE